MNMKSNFTKEEQGLTFDSRGVEKERDEGLSTSPHKPLQTKNNDITTIELHCIASEESLLSDTAYAYVEINANLAQYLDTGRFFIHGNYEYFLWEKLRKNVYAKITHSAQYMYRQYKRYFPSGKIVGGLFIPSTTEDAHNQFVLDVEQAEPSLNNLERERNAWFDTFGHKLTTIGYYSERNANVFLYEWLFEVQQYPEFGRLYTRAIIQYKPEHFRIRYYEEKKLSESKWNFLKKQSVDPYILTINKGITIDTDWIKMPSTSTQDSR